jgi:hypothetical protein
MFLIPKELKHKQHTPTAAAHMIKQYDALQPTACDMTEAMRDVVGAWVKDKTTTPQQANGKPLSPGYVSTMLTEVKQYTGNKLGRKDVAEHLTFGELRFDLIKKRTAIVDSNNSSIVAVDFTPYIERAVEELKLTKRASDTTFDNYLCRKMAALFVVLRLRKMELLLKTTLTPCEGDEHAVIADRIQKAGSKKANRDAEGCKVGAFRIQIQGTTADVVLWNFELLREDLTRKGVDEKETTRLCQNISKRVTLQLQLMFPELVQLYNDKPGSKGFSLHSVRHIGEAYCATVYKPSNMTRDLYRMQLFHHDNRSVGAHYARFNHVVGASLPDFKDVPTESYDDSDSDDSDDEQDSDDDQDGDSDDEQDDVPDEAAVQDNSDSAYPDEVNAYTAECDADTAAMEELKQRALMREKQLAEIEKQKAEIETQKAEDELIEVAILARDVKRKHVVTALEAIEKMDVPHVYKEMFKLQAVKKRRCMY